MARELMRHSKVDLTAKHYTRLTLIDRRKAVGMLPEADGQVAVKTRTSGGGQDRCLDGDRKPQFSSARLSQGKPAEGQSGGQPSPYNSLKQKKIPCASAETQGSKVDAADET